MINETFALLKGFYVDRFSLPSEDVVLAAKRLWGEKLIKFTRDQIKQAIDQLEKHNVYKHRAPTMGEFMELLEGNKSSAPEHRLFVPQLTQKSDPGIASENLAKIREMLKITNKS